MSIADRVEPMAGFLLVEDDKAPEAIGSIVLAETASLRPTSGVVIKASPELRFDYPEGTRVLFGMNAGEVLVIDGMKVKTLHESEIQAVVD